MYQTQHEDFLPLLISSNALAYLEQPFNPESYASENLYSDDEFVIYYFIFIFSNFIYFISLFG